MSAPIPLRLPAVNDSGTEQERKAFKLAVDMPLEERERFDLTATFFPHRLAQIYPAWPEFVARLRRSDEAERILFAERQAKRIVLSVVGLIFGGILALIVVLAAA